MDPMNRSPREIQDQGYEDQVATCCGEYYWRCECHETQAPACTETPDSAADRIPTAPLGVEVLP